MKSILTITSGCKNQYLKIVHPYTIIPIISFQVKMVQIIIQKMTFSIMRLDFILRLMCDHHALSLCAGIVYNWCFILVQTHWLMTHIHTYSHCSTYKHLIYSCYIYHSFSSHILYVFPHCCQTVFTSEFVSELNWMQNLISRART